MEQQMTMCTIVIDKSSTKNNLKENKYEYREVFLEKLWALLTHFSKDSFTIINIVHKDWL